ncbi:uncharacterized protein LOC130730850 [Lotus japonicus]|uniref:uncharacterized protein LOC130730850 n=1 Tax=Lotus japonicus TaxID=34305 RepID=UPI00258EB081|nr:uncharacterized protein LOC130730850 [Lotus japonicus]
MRAPPSEGWKEMGGGSQSSGSYSCSQRRKGGPICDCGFQAPLVTSWTGDNPGRKFYGCGLFKKHGKRVCRFFVWYDEYHGLVKCDRFDEEVAREKKIIGTLLRKIDDMKKKERLLEISLVTCIVLMILLVFAYVNK